MAGPRVGFPTVGKARQHMAKSYNIGVIGGDGTGPEVTREALKVLGVAQRKFGFTLSYTDYDFGGARYLRTGETLPDTALATVPASACRCR